MSEAIFVEGSFLDSLEIDIKAIFQIGNGCETI